MTQILITTIVTFICKHSLIFVHQIYYILYICMFYCTNRLKMHKVIELESEDIIYYALLDENVV